MSDPDPLPALRAAGAMIGTANEHYWLELLRVFTDPGVRFGIARAKYATDARQVTADDVADVLDHRFGRAPPAVVIPAGTIVVGSRIDVVCTLSVNAPAPRPARRGRVGHCAARIAEVLRTLGGRATAMQIAAAGIPYGSIHTTVRRADARFIVHRQPGTNAILIELRPDAP